MVLVGKGLTKTGVGDVRGRSLFIRYDFACTVRTC